MRSPRSLLLAMTLVVAGCSTETLPPEASGPVVQDRYALTSPALKGVTNAGGEALTALSIPVPAGTEAGDVLVVQLTNRQHVEAVATAPAGWTLLRSEQSAWEIRSWLFLRVATASEPTSHTFSLDVASTTTGMMAAVSGVDPTQPIDVHLGQKNGNSASLALPAATTSGADGLAVWFAAQVWTGTSCPNVHTPPTGFTEQLDTCFVAGSRGVLMSAATSELGAAGPQPAFTGSSTLPNTNIAHAVVLRAASAPPAPEISVVDATHASGKGITSLTLDTPAGVSQGDVLLAHFANRNHIDAELTPPAGWSLVRSDMSSWTIRGWVFARVVTANEPASHTFTSSIASYLVGNVVAFTGADPIQPIDTHAGRTNSGSTQFTTPSFTTSSAGGLAVWFGAQAWIGDPCPASSISPPTGYDETYDRCLVSSSSGLVFNAATQALGAAGSQPAPVGTSTFAETNVAQVVALRAPQPAQPSGVAFRSGAQQSGTSVSSLDVPRPAGTEADDVLIARVSLRNNVDATVTPPTGWTLQDSQQSAWALRTWIFSKVAGASEPASYVFGFDVSANAVATIDAFSGADPLAPIDVVAGQKNGESMALAVPDVVTTGANGLAVWMSTQIQDATTCPDPSLEPPLGFTETSDNCLGASSGLLYNAAHKALVAPGLQTGLSGSSPFAQTNTAHVAVLRSATAAACFVGDTYASSWTQQGVVAAPEIVEPSGLAASRLVDGALYVHNEDTTAIVAISTADASTVGVYDVSNVVPADWEDIATGPCPAGSCIFIGDIGKWSANFPPGGSPTTFTVYRVPEPDLANGQTTGDLVAEAFPFVYPDGAKDAESLMVHPTTGDIYVITKDASGLSGVYRFPQPLPAAGVQSTLIHVADLQLPFDEDSNAMAATSAAIHPCADRFLLRTYRRVYEFRATPGQGFESAFLATPVTLTDTQEGQGEAIEYEANGASYFTMSESPSPFRLRRVPVQ